MAVSHSGRMHRARCGSACRRFAARPRNGSRVQDSWTKCAPTIVAATCLSPAGKTYYLRPVHEDWQVLGLARPRLAEERQWRRWIRTGKKNLPPPGSRRSALSALTDVARGAIDAMVRRTERLGHCRFALRESHGFGNR